MFRNTLILIYRNLHRHRTFSLINICGLTLSFAGAFMIAIWLHSELSMDRFHEHAPTTFKVMHDAQYSDGKRVIGSNTTYALLEAIRTDVSGVKNGVRTFYESTHLIKVGEKKLRSGGTYTDQDFFEMFSFNVLQGDFGNLLVDPYSVVLTQDLAERLFDDENPVGRSISVDSWLLKHDFVVTGVVENPPLNSSIEFDMLFPVHVIALHQDWVTNWGTSGMNTYLRLEDGVASKNVLEQILPLPTKYHKYANYELFLQPFEDAYLYNEFNGSREATGRIAYVQIFALVGLVLLTFGAINFINLTTAHATKRAKEIGVKKVLGAGRGVLIRQLLVESLILSTLSALLAVSVVQLTLPFFNEIIDRNLVIPLIDPVFVALMCGITVVTGLIAGIYPALVLVSFNARESIKGGFGKTSVLGTFRQGLVWFQLIISSVLVIATIVVYSQIDYMINKRLGLDTEHVLFFEVHDGITESLLAFKNDINRQSGVISMAYSSGNPVKVYNYSGDPVWEGKDPDSKIAFPFIDCGFDFVETLGIKMKEGRSFSAEIKSDSSAFIVNEEAVKMMGLENPVGKNFKFWAKEGKIIGVMENFHFKSMHDAIGPMVLRLWPQRAFFAMVKVNTQDISHTMEALESTYSRYETEFPFDPQFLDKSYERHYRSEQAMSELVQVFAIVAIVISILGLYGLVAFMTERKAKEIGIRKVLGASVVSILKLVSVKFIVWTIAANVIAWPIGMYLTNQWLEGFAYRIDIQWSFFLYTLLTTLLIAGLTVSIKSVGAALSNPVDVLRNE